MRAFLIEGFSGVGSLTSRTYEANMFGITYLLSSAVVYNSMFPVDCQPDEPSPLSVQVRGMRTSGDA